MSQRYGNGKQKQKERRLTNRCETENKNEKREEKQTFEMQRVRNKDKDKSFKSYYNIDGERRTEGEWKLKRQRREMEKKSTEKWKDIITTEREADTHKVITSVAIFEAKWQRKSEKSPDLEREKQQ